jgi:hypothetical protein
MQEIWLGLKHAFHSRQGHTNVYLH